MTCPNCKKPFLKERDDKFQCVDCGWFEKVDNDWRVCEEPAPEPESPPTPEPEPDPAQRDPSPAALEPDPAALEPDPARLEDIQANVNPPGVHNVKKILGGLITITEVDE